MKFAYDIPDSFWSLFRSMNRELYMEALLKINEEYEYNNYYLSKEVCLQVLEDWNESQRSGYLLKNLNQKLMQARHHQTAS